MGNIYRSTLVILLPALLLSASVHAQVWAPSSDLEGRIEPSEAEYVQSGARQGKSPIEGQDPTQTVRRFDFRYQYRNLPTHNNDQANIFTFRADDVWQLNESWRISGRIELPLAYTNEVGNNRAAGGTDGAFRLGIGEVVAQVLSIHKINERTAIAFGTQAIFPTANPEYLGVNQYRFVPTFVARWMLPEIGLGTYFAPIVRYNFDIARSSNRSHISELQFSPTFTTILPDNWFVTLFPGTAGADIRYNFGRRQPSDKGRLFLPADFMVGKILGQNTLASIEIGVPVIKDYKGSTLLGTYDFKLEARIAYFF